MTTSSPLRKLLEEPLIHFVAGALLVFGFFWITGTDRDPADYTIIVDQRDIDRLRAGWIQSFRRAPSAPEMDGMIEQEISEEIYYREALRLGLDRNDPVIRRRMFTKMRFLDNQDLAQSEPVDADLQEWMEQNPDRYRLPTTYDLEQIYLGQNLPANRREIENLLDGLNSETIRPQDISKPISLPQRLSGADSFKIARQFGEQFAIDLDTLETGQWVGPVSSGFGDHLIKVTSRNLGETVALNDVRQAVLNDWLAAQRQLQEEETLERYRSQYDIRVAGRE